MDNKPLKIFILEDLPTDLQLVKRQILKYEPNCTFLVATDRASFEKNLRWTIQPDLVLSDYDLPDMNGLNALTKVRKKLPGIPFIFVTGTLNNEEKVAATILKGADGFVLKDNLSTLPQVVDDVLKKSKKKRLRARQKAERKRERSVLLQKLESKVMKISTEEKQDILKIIHQLQNL